jgi:hypothetical protein
MQALTKLWANRLRIALVAVSLLCLIMWVCNSVLQVERDTNHENLQIALSDARSLRNEKDELVQEVKTHTATKAQLLHLSDSLFALHAKDERRIKEVTRLVVMKQSVQLDKPVHAAWTSPAGTQGQHTPPSKGEMEGECIPVPAAFAYESEDISLQGTVRADGVSIDSLVMPNTLIIREATRRKGFLGWGRESIVQWHNTNPLWRSDRAAYYTVPKHVSRWNGWIKPALVGIGAACLTTYVHQQLR